MRAGSETPESLAELSARLQEVVAGLREWADREAATAGPPEPPIADAGPPGAGGWPPALLAGLRALVSQNDAMALERCEELLERTPPAAREGLRAVQKALSEYDFDGAGARLDALAPEEAGNA